MSDRDEIDARMHRMDAALPRGPVRDVQMPPYQFQREEFGFGGIAMREVPDTDLVCTVCRWRGGHASTCPHRDAPWPKISVPAVSKRPYHMPSLEEINAASRDPHALLDILRSMQGQVWACFERSVRDYALAAKAKGKRLAITPVSIGEGTLDRDPAAPHRFNLKADTRLLGPVERCPASFVIVDVVDGALVIVEVGDGVRLLSTP